MKKLMMFAAVAALTVGVHAAACSWALTGSGTLSNPTGVTLSGLSDATLYVYMTTATGSTLSNERKSLLATLKSNDTPSGYYTSYALSSGQLSAKSLETDSTAGTKYSFYGVVIASASDGSEYAYFTSSGNGNAIETADGTTDISLNLSATTLKDIGTTAAASAAWYTIKEAPEPTSGLLMLLGLGALALRRKRA